MRIALFSDSHGNARALEAVMTAIDTHGTFDHIVFAGDLAWGGIGAKTCVDALRARDDIDAVYGNADYFLWSPLESLPDNATGEQRERRILMEAWCRWTQDEIGDERIKYLENLPFSLRYQPTDNPANDLLVVHANPKDVFDVIFPSHEKQKTIFGEIKQTDEPVSEMLKDVDCHTIALAHTHIPDIRHIGEHRLVNISSVSRAGDGDSRAKYAIMTFNKGAWQVEHRTVDYDIEATVQAVMASDMPGKEIEAKSLQQKPG